MTTALSDFTVVDLTTQLPGPYCTMMLGDLGARIIKVEPPGGDPLRAFPPMFASVNRSKQSIVVDLKEEAGREVLSRLFKQADAVLEGFRPGVARRLSVDYDTARRINPAVVYCAISGFGQEGPYRTRAGHDLNYLAIGGLLGRTDPPSPPPVLISDLSSGLYAATAVTAALTHRMKTGEGQFIDLSMTDCVLSWMAPEIARAHAEGRPPDQPLLADLPHYEVFETSDGLFISLGIVYETHFWQRFCDLVGLAEWRNWTTEERTARQADIRLRLKDIFAGASRAAWDSRLQAADIPCGPVYGLDEMENDPYIKHRHPFFHLTDSEGMESRQVKPPYRSGHKADHAAKPPPLPGEHTDLIMKEAGYSPLAIKQLNKRGIVVSR